MKILFVCRGNIGRSQMAKEFFNASCKDGYSADACGTRVGEFEGQLIKDIQNDSVEDDIRAMREVGLDVSNNARKNITPDLVENADRVIVMAERDTLPEYLLSNPKVTYWEIENPKGQTYEKTCEIRDAVRDSVESFLRTI